jgi:hypothetical protein
MLTIDKASLETIESHLLRTGGGNHTDNMRRLRRFECHCLVTLPEREFFELVFLQTDETVMISPRGGDRTLRAVAKRATNNPQPRLSANWDLVENLRRMRERLREGNMSQQPLVLCEARNGEEQHGPWYLQDGSHRALAYATLILLNEAQYEPQTAYCSMSRQKFQSLTS